MTEDLSTRHDLISSLFTLPSSPQEWERYRLSDEQVEFFHEFGYLKGIQMLTESQVETLREELSKLMDPSHPGHHLFYEFHSNESNDPNKCFSMLWAPGGSCLVSTIFFGIRRSPCPPPNY